MRATVKVRCVQCGFTREIAPGEIPADEIPMCPRDFAIMVPVSATARIG